MPILSLLFFRRHPNGIHFHQIANRYLQPLSQGKRAWFFPSSLLWSTAKSQTLHLSLTRRSHPVYSLTWEVAPSTIYSCKSFFSGNVRVNETCRGRITGLTPLWSKPLLPCLNTLTSPISSPTYIFLIYIICLLVFIALLLMCYQRAYGIHLQCRPICL